GCAAASDRADLDAGRRDRPDHSGTSAVDRRRTCEAAAEAAARSARDLGDRGAPRGARARLHADRGGGAGARRRAETDPDSRPALTLGLLLDVRHVVLQLAARARTVRRARLRRRARAVSPARAEPFAPVLDAGRESPARLARAA